MTPVRLSSAVRVAREAVSVLALVLVGLLFIALGVYLVVQSLAHEPHDNKIIYVGVGVAVFGGLLIPGIFPVAQRIYIAVFPNGLPLLGGKRSGDPPAPPAAP